MKFKWRYLIWLIPILIIVFVSSCANYRFGILESDYPKYFSLDTDHDKSSFAALQNRLLKSNSKYSWQTRLPVGEKLITVEHGVLASKADIERLGLPAGNYLFFSMEMPVGLIVSIQVSHVYNGENLQPVGSYIFRGHEFLDEKCKIAGSRWNISDYDGGGLSEQCGFGYVRVYELPEAAQILVSKRNPFLFSDGLRQSIVIATVQKGMPHSYRFDLMAHWHKATSLFWRIMTIT